MTDVRWVFGPGDLRRPGSRKHPRSRLRDPRPAGGRSGWTARTWSGCLNAGWPGCAWFLLGKVFHW